jgi:hypothetical protein
LAKLTVSVPIAAGARRVQQVRGGHHAAELVAVRQRVDQHVRAGLAAVEAVHVGSTPVLPRAVGRQVAGQDFELLVNGTGRGARGC